MIMDSDKFDDPIEDLFRRFDKQQNFTYSISADVFPEMRWRGSYEGLKVTAVQHQLTTLRSFVNDAPSSRRSLPAFTCRSAALLFECGSQKCNSSCVVLSATQTTACIPCGHSCPTRTQRSDFPAGRPHASMDTRVLLAFCIVRLSALASNGTTTLGSAGTCCLIHRAAAAMQLEVPSVWEDSPEQVAEMQILEARKERAKKGVVQGRGLQEGDLAMVAFEARRLSDDEPMPGTKHDRMQLDTTNPLHVPMPGLLTCDAFYHAMSVQGFAQLQHTSSLFVRPAP